jgi:hypothetical protein
MVVNVDLPWNPAVLEQRIGRVHRLGQRRPVRVVNFVARGTIEEGMLEVLRFKKSLFAGVLDGGEKEVFLGGSRLTKFMESVEKATSAISDGGADDRADSPALQGDDDEEAPPAPAGRPGLTEAERDARKARPGRPDLTPAAASSDPWSGLLQTGLAVLEQVAAAARAGSTGRTPADSPFSSFVARDEHTGQSYLHLPMPSPDLLDRALQAFSALLQPANR